MFIQSLDSSQMCGEHELNNWWVRFIVYNAHKADQAIKPIMKSKFAMVKYANI